MELYIAKVLVVLDKWSDIGSFVEKCPGLSSEVQEGYKRHIKTLQRRKEQEEIDKIEEIKETGLFRIYSQYIYRNIQIFSTI